jgi:hypothetical protein
MRKLGFVSATLFLTAILLAGFSSSGLQSGHGPCREPDGVSFHLAHGPYMVPSGGTFRLAHGPYGVPNGGIKPVHGPYAVPSGGSFQLA